MKIKINKTDGSHRMLYLLMNQDETYSFVSLEKGKIYPCTFHTKEEALRDIMTYQSYIPNSSYEIIEDDSSCSFCKETNCFISERKMIEGKDVFVRARADMEFNQIDLEFGTLGNQGEVFGEWSNSLDISYCPVCGKRLLPTEYTTLGNS